MVTEAVVRHFLSQRAIAVAGVSASGKGFGNTIVKELGRKGYEVHIVHPEAKEMNGQTCVSSLVELPKEVEALLTVVPPDRTETLVKQAAEAGIKTVWMQQGSESEAALRLCEEQGIDAVVGECILMFAAPTGIHKFHQWLWGLFGKLPKDED